MVATACLWKPSGPGVGGKNLLSSLLEAYASLGTLILLARNAALNTSTLLTASLCDIDAPLLEELGRAY